MASAWFYLSFAKPNLIVNTDLLIILCNYFSLILKAEILFPPQLYLKRFILYGQSLMVTSIKLPYFDYNDGYYHHNIETFALSGEIKTQNFGEKFNVSNLDAGNIKILVKLYPPSLNGKMC